jgi:diacylglycerol kinase (ATP)
MAPPAGSAPIAVIANAAAGGRRGRAIGEHVAAELSRAGLASELLLTTARGHATELAAAALARGARRIVVCGGDGTVQEVVRALTGASAELGIVPCGRGNDLARVLGIPADPDQAAAIAGTGAVRRIDLGWVKARDPGAEGAGGGGPDAGSTGGAPRPFTTVAAIGFDSEAAAFVHRSHLPLPGPLAYLAAVARTLVTFRSPEIRIAGDFGTFEGRVLLLATGNTSTYGGGMQVVPGAVCDDGLLDLCIVRAIPRHTVLAAFPRIFAGTHVALPFVETRRARWIRVEASRPLWVYADGEPLGMTPAEITIESRALAVLVPA